MRSIVKYTDYKQFRATSRIIYNGEDITNNKAPDAQTPPAKTGQEMRDSTQLAPIRSRDTDASLDQPNRSSA